MGERSLRFILPASRDAGSFALALDAIESSSVRGQALAASNSAFLLPAKEPKRFSRQGSCAAGNARAGSRDSLDCVPSLERRQTAGKATDRFP